jgi:hypothetical protein
MVCARNLGLTDLPIVCISVDDYYLSFENMLERAWQEGLLKNKPEKIIKFVSSAHGAVSWLEEKKQEGNAKEIPTIKRRSSIMRRTSFFSPPVISRSMSWFTNSNQSSWSSDQRWGWLARTIIPFTAGLLAGAASASQMRKHR